MYPLCFSRIKMDDTLPLIREEQQPRLQPIDSEGFYKVDKALYGYRGSPRFWKDAVAEAAKDLGLKNPARLTTLCTVTPENSLNTCTLTIGHDQLVRDMVQKLKQKFFVKKVDFLVKVVDTIEILGRTKLVCRFITSSWYIDQSFKDVDMEKCNPVSTPGLHLTEKDLVTEEQLPAVPAGLYRQVTGRLLHGAGQQPDAQQAV